MDIEKIKAVINKNTNLSTTLGIEFLSTPQDNTCMAKMKVDQRNRQPFGFLSGGASLALAENLAGVGSMALCPNKICLGINVTGSHLTAVKQGDTVTALATLQHKGKTLHQWHIEITNSKGKLVCTSQVTNYILKTSDNE